MFTLLKRLNISLAGKRVPPSQPCVSLFLCHFKPCPPGTNCDGDLGPIDEIPELVQNSCPLGYYCVIGSQASDPIPCPAGTYGFVFKP